MIDEKTMIKLQDIIISLDNRTADVSLLYFSKGIIEITNDESIVASEGSEINFNSYFNSFSVAKWKKYTNINDLFINIKFKGKAEITVFSNKLLYGAVSSNVVYKRVVDNDVLKAISIPIDLESNAVSYAFSIKVLSDEFIFYGGCYSSSTQINQRDIRIAIIFTTYNRERYIRDNLNNINKLNGCNIHTYVVDNASSLPRDFGKDISIIQNINSGGAGGFTRGMLASIDDNSLYKYTHCLLMDDDAYVDSHVLKRLIIFLSLVKTEYVDTVVAGAMLRKDISYYQVEAGATWNGGLIISNGHDVDLRDSRNVLINSMEKESDYAAWWFCAIPFSHITSDNLAIPIFVFNDDVDFGIRNNLHIITLNGLCVWHDAFESKKNAMRCYYESRNKMIVNSCNDIEVSKSTVIKTLKSTIKNSIYLYQYQNAEAILEGIRDYLKGPSWLCSIRPDEYNKKILSRNIQLIDMDPLTLDYDWYRLCCTIKDCDLLHKIVRILTKNGYYLKADRDIILPFYASNVEAGYRAKSITYYDEITSKGFYVERDSKRRKRILKECKEICKAIKANYKRVSKEYKDCYKFMISRDQWEKYLGLQKGTY